MFIPMDIQKYVSDKEDDSTIEAVLHCTGDWTVATQLKTHSHTPTYSTAAHNKQQRSKE